MQTNTGDINQILGKHNRPHIEGPGETALKQAQANMEERKLDIEQNKIDSLFNLESRKLENEENKTASEIDLKQDQLDIERNRFQIEQDRYLYIEKAKAQAEIAAQKAKDDLELKGKQLAYKEEEINILLNRETPEVITTLYKMLLDLKIIKRRT